MSRTFLALCGAALVSTALVGAQGKSSGDSNNSSAASANAVTFTGCLSPGSNSESYYLTNAKQKGVKNSDKALKIVAGTPKVKLEPLVTQEIEVTGTIDPPDSPAGNDNSGKARTLTVTKVKVRTESCG